MKKGYEFFSAFARNVQKFGNNNRNTTDNIKEYYCEEG